LLANSGALEEALVFFQKAAQSGHPKGEKYAAQVERMLRLR